MIRAIKIAVFVLLLAGVSVTLSPLATKAQEYHHCIDFITGGGSFMPRVEGGAPDRVNFGFNAGGRSENNPEVKGHFNLVDHNDPQIHVSGINVDYYGVIGPPEPPPPVGCECRTFRGDAKLNGEPGFRYEVTACDFGEPGRDDRIRVTVRLGSDAGPTVYFADNFLSTKVCPPGATSCGDLDGGNIQLHKACPCP
jgi:hypothetical protein